MQKIGKIAVAILLFVITSYCAFADVYISQVYYDPILTESGGEAIELYNSGNSSISLQNYSIKTESAEKDIILWNFSIAANSYFLIADLGWSKSKDNVSWVDADYEETMNMYNTDSGIALVDNFGKIIDAVGWGNKSLIDAGLYQGEPANGVNVGNVLMRKNITGDNSKDFEQSLPVLRNSNSTINLFNLEANSSYNLNITVEILNSAPKILKLDILDENSFTSGIQIYPEAGKNKSVEVQLTTFDQDGAEDLDYAEILFIGKTVQQITTAKNKNLDSTKAVFIGNIELEYFLEPKDYEMQIRVYDKDKNFAEQSSSIGYQSLAAFTFDSNEFDLSSKANSSSMLYGDLEVNTKNKPTLQNIGNVAVYFGMQNKGFSGIDEIQFSIDHGDFINFNSNIGINDKIIGPQQNAAVDLMLKTSENISKGLYSGEITMYAFAK